MKTQEDGLLGTWELVRYEDEKANTITEAPDINDPIMITFMDAQFEGTTNANTFFGDYTVESKLLTFKNFYGTEAGESEWGLMFRDAIVKAYDSNNSNYKFFFSIDDNVLKLEYDESQFMIFKR